MRRRAPAKWKKYYTGLFPWQLPKQTKKAPGTALCSSLPLFARCAGAYAGRTIPVQIPDDVSNTSPGSRKDNYNDTEEICQTRRRCRNICRGPTCGNVEQFSPCNGY